MADMDIETGVPLPAHHRRGPPNKYPFPDMEVGDSFHTEEPIGRVGPAAVRYGRRHGMRFSCRSVEGGTRVWRIATDG